MWKGMPCSQLIILQKEYFKTDLPLLSTFGTCCPGQKPSKSLGKPGILSIILFQQPSLAQSNVQPPI